MEWISVKDRMPKESLKVRVKDHYDALYAGHYSLGIGQFISHRDNVIQQVTHWMPLPKPPNK